MKKEIVLKLNEINKNFYKITAVEFDGSRQYYWKGWERLLEELDFTKIRSVLDIGCGNGRFGSFIAENTEVESYTGIDTSKKLLEEANFRLQNSKLGYELLEKDIIEEDLKFQEKFDLIVMFGVLHHIPSFDNRKRIISKLSELINEDGIIVITAWQFNKIPRFKELMQDQESVLNEVNIEKEDLEKDDYILDWKRGESAYRYTHLTTEEEFKRLIPKGLELVRTFEADGKSGGVNRYFVIAQSIEHRALDLPKKKSYLCRPERAVPARTLVTAWSRGAISSI